VAKNRAFAEKFAFPYPLLSDPDRAVGVAYGAADSPSSGTARRITYLIDPDGVIQGTWGQTAKIDTRAHAEDVLAQIA
jgi:peroxiredoxin Q/BCP